RSNGMKGFLYRMRFTSLLLACLTNVLAAWVLRRKLSSTTGSRCRGVYSLRRPGTCSARICSNVCANEPSTEPAESYLLNWRVRTALQSSGKLRHHDFIPGLKMLEALGDTPRTWSGLPVQLERAQSCCDGFSTPISSVQFRKNARRPLGR